MIVSSWMLWLAGACFFLSGFIVGREVDRREAKRWLAESGLDVEEIAEHDRADGDWRWVPKS